MKNISRLYVKYIIKTPIIFYFFLIVCVGIFLYMSLTLKLDIVQTVNASVSNNKVVIDGKYNNNSNVIYLYNNRNEKIYKQKIESIESENGQTVFIINNIDNLSGDIHVDIVTGKQSLFKRIFIKAGKG